eukprot:1920428-Prymnesium_polylepis.1
MRASIGSRAVAIISSARCAMYRLQICLLSSRGANAFANAAGRLPMRFARHASKKKSKPLPM